MFRCSPYFSFFFDGTGNNKDADEELKKWSNPARLWRNGIEFALDEAKKSPSNIQNNYAIYVSGVGTRFNGQLSIFQRALAMIQDHGGLGLAAGTGRHSTS